ncbi:MAG TPA: zinc ribbon domain-containing protein [Gaiellaceae bacterium]|nr:zinc ribbon domain-containing protein [Gaiellaceae bacterium]
MTLASFISSGTSHAVLNGLLFFAFVLWLCLGFWTYKDAKRRMEDPLFIGLSVLVALVIPYVGPFIYMLFRPPEYLEDVRERELEIKAIEDRIAHADHRCPVCHAEVDEAYLVCPVCTTKLKQACVNCSAPLEPIWQVCPYCETPIEPADPGAPPALGTRRGRRSTSVRR